MAKRKRTYSNRYALIFLILILLVAAIPTAVKYYKGSSNWEDVAKTVGIAENKDIENYPFSIHFIDVGQGNCTLVSSKSGNILIDSGELYAKTTVFEYLDNLRIEKIDYLIATHQHSDHIGCMASIVKRYEIGKFFMPELDDSDIPTSSCYESLLSALEDKNVDCSFMKSGDSFPLGDIKCTASAPVSVIKGDINNMSIVLKIRYKNTSFLITGDAGTEEEKTILKTDADLNSDVLLVGHHGSRKSTSNAFLDAVSPEIAVISCGEGNQYNHPHKETLKKLDEYNIKYYRTDEDSTVIFCSDGEKIYCQSGE